VLCGVSWSHGAAAQTRDEAESRRLFEQGRTLADAGNCEAAIPILKRSLDAHSSVGSHLTLAECYARFDLLAAWRENKEAERVAVQQSDSRRDYARREAEGMATHLSRIRVALPAGTTGARVELDGVPLDPFYYDGGRSR
jgi:hypothetical protein